jgi:hypothetical protein
MQPRKFNRSLPVKMSSEEQATAALELARTCAELRDLKVEKDQVYAAWRKRIKDYDGRVSHAVEQVNKGLQTAEVEIEESYDLEREEATLTRLDTGEVIEVRPMTQDEIEQARQLELPEAE